MRPCWVETLLANMNPAGCAPGAPAPLARKGRGLRCCQCPRWPALQSKDHVSLSSMVISGWFFFLVLPVYCYQPISLHPHAHMLNHVIPWTSARQTPLSMDFSRQEYWSGLPFPSLFRVVFHSSICKAPAGRINTNNLVEVGLHLSETPMEARYGVCRPGCVALG